MTQRGKTWDAQVSTQKLPMSVPHLHRQLQAQLNEQGVGGRVWGVVNPILKSRGFKQGLRVSNTTYFKTHFYKDFHT